MFLNIPLILNTVTLCRRRLTSHYIRSLYTILSTRLKIGGVFLY